MLVDQLRAEYRDRFVHRGYAQALKFDPSQPRNEKGQWTDTGSRWRQGPEDERPYDGKNTLRGDAYTIPPITHTKLIRDGGMWGSSHGNSKVMTGESAKQMGISGYTDREANELAVTAVDKFLTAIAEDKAGSEEILHHVFQNVRGTEFKVGDTVDLPLTAASGEVGRSYGVRSDAKDQEGQPTIFEFEKGTQMAPYGCYWTKRQLEDDGQTKEEAIKEFGVIWTEAIVAGGFEVIGTEEVYFGSQHSDMGGGIGEPGVTHQISARVVRLRQTKTFDPVTKKWVPRG